MKKDFHYLIGIIVFAAVLSGGFFVAGAHATTCGITDIKSAPGAGDTEFVFDCERNTGNCDFTLQDGQVGGDDIEQGDFVIIHEEPQDGWEFGGIECVGDPGIVVTQLPDGWTTQCVVPESVTVCTIINIPTNRTVPTLSEWGMISAAAGLGLIGVFFAVRRKRLQASA